jgi:Ca2+-binding EF-hand superfamily protein
MDKIRKALLATGIVALGLTGIAGASLAGDKGDGHRGRGGFGPGFLERLDGNTDGKVTQAEIDQIRQDRLAEFDENGDGSLSLEEYQALWLSVVRERMVDRFQALDDDGDAIVTVEEYVEPFSRMVSRLDRNDDGELTSDDMRRRHGHHGRNERGHHR